MNLPGQSATRGDAHTVATGGQQLTENRKHPRISAALRCWCEGENVTLYARVGNLSEGGLYLRTSTPLPKGARAVLRFGGSEAEVVTPATVVWSRGEGENGPPGMGLVFDELDPEKVTRIREIIRGEGKSGTLTNS